LLYILIGQTSDILIPNCLLPERFSGDRYMWGMNYFCLRQGDILQLHRLNQDEQWFFHQGLSIKLHIFTSKGEYSNIIIGNNIKNGDLLQGVCPNDTWFGGEVINNDSNDYEFSLSSCNLSPSWDEKDSFSPSKEDIDNLKMKFPNFINIIDLLSSN
jgi:predicted cupin superfamily sugar epimerase